MPNYNVKRRSIITETIPVTAADPASAVAAIQASAPSPALSDAGTTITLTKHPQGNAVRTQQRWKTNEAGDNGGTGGGTTGGGTTGGTGA
jgi:hypothetical protein